MASLQLVLFVCSVAVIKTASAVGMKKLARYFFVFVKLARQPETYPFR